MKKSLVLLVTTALLANVAANSVVFATEGTEVEATNVSAEPRSQRFAEELKSFRDELAHRQASGWITPPGAENTIQEVLEYLDITVSQYSNNQIEQISEEEHESLKLGLRNFIDSLLEPETPEKPGTPETPEQPKQPETKPGDNNTTPEKPETKPGDNNTTPEKPETKPGDNNTTPEKPTTETPGKPAQPKEEAPEADAVKPSAEAPKEQKSENNQPTLPNTGDAGNKQLPKTGEDDGFAIFGYAALTVLASVGLVAYGKREDA